MKQLKRSILLALLISLFATAIGFSQANQPQPNWQNLDYGTDSLMGISLDKAYSELLRGKKSESVIVAVLDGGVDIAHEDLQSVIYSNKKEKLNGIDDDHNGYVDDVNGWNFLGNADKDINFETLELVRQLRILKRRIEEKVLDTASNIQDPDYKKFGLLKAEYLKTYEETSRIFSGISGFKATLENMESKIGENALDLKGFSNFKPQEPEEVYVKKAVVDVLLDGDTDYKTFKKNEIDDVYDHYYEKLNYQLNLDYNPRAELGISTQTRFYGNNHVIGPDAMHGTHVAGIIAADRNNKMGINGIADNVKILSVRTVPNGDEHDVDVANAIRYAVDQGAKIINMSFGKSYSNNKKLVDDAVKYADSKDVLIVHAAGNDNKNLDLESNFPNKFYEDGNGVAASWLEIGASAPLIDEHLKANFSNYGKTTVDVFAPGVQIYSTTPNSTYQSLNGTSMASPVVTGIAALIRSYYPKLTALQVKEIIMKSSVKIDQKVTVLINENPVDLSFSDLSVTGGIANAYFALKMANDLNKGIAIQ